VIEVNSAAGLVGLSAARLAKSVTLTMPTQLGVRLASLNLMMFAGNGKAKRRWSGATKPSISLLGTHGRPVPAYVYTLPVTERGAKELRRQWQWDSGTAMRGLQAQMVAPCFGLMIAAVVDEDTEGLLQCGAELLSDDGTLVAAAPLLRQHAIMALARSAPGHGLEVELDEDLLDSATGERTAHVISLRRAKPSLN